MDKNTLIGFLLMALVVFGFMAYESKKQKEYAVEQQKAAIEQQMNQAQENKQKAIEAEKAANAIAEEKSDSLNPLYKARIVNEGKTVIENELLKLTISNKGGQLCRAELKDETYKNQEGGAVVLFDDKDMDMNFMLTGKNQNITSNELYFTPKEVTDSSVVMSLPIGKGSIDIRYSLIPGSYIVNMSLKANGISNFFPANANKLNIHWNESLRQQEKGYSFENQHSTIVYRTVEDDTENLSSTGADDTENNFDSNAIWVAFKDQFFSQVLITDKSLALDEISSKRLEEGSGYLKEYNASMSADFDPTGKVASNFQMYIGPNKFSTLRENQKLCISENDVDLQSLVYLGWPIIRWINRFFTVYMFDWMTGWGINMGIVLLLLTIIVKLLVFPLMKKSFMSSANMRVLRPKVEEISKKYPKPEDAMKKQQEIMQLYSMHGVSPMGGCLPMLIQMPIWIALFNFIPNAIELRGQSFLWADDLSTYDDVINWGTHIWGIGDHLSLFCVLWCLSTVANTWISMRQQQYSMTPEQEKQMGMMKWMSYIMPLIFFFTFNSYSSGLNYYYFISGVVTLLMMWYLRKTTDDDKLLAKLEAKYEQRKSQPHKKSGMMARYESLLEKQREMLEQQQKMQQRKK